MDAHTIKTLIEAGLDDASAEVIGDDGTHFHATVVAPVFAGKSMIECHRLVYATLGERMGTEIHALQLRTRAPE